MRGVVNHPADAEAVETDAPVRTPGHVVHTLTLLIVTASTQCSKVDVGLFARVGVEYHGRVVANAESVAQRWHHIAPHDDVTSVNGHAHVQNE